MRRAERLFRLIEYLRGRRLAITADDLAAELEVSTRTIYRDVSTLQATGAPINGEAGVGYMLDPSYHLPPIMFEPDEVQALLAGLRIAAAATDDDLAAAGARAETKIRAVLNDQALARADRSPYVAPFMAEDMALRDHHRTIRKACENRRKLKMDYGDSDEAGHLAHRAAALAVCVDILRVVRTARRSPAFPGFTDQGAGNAGRTVSELSGKQRKGNGAPVRVPDLDQQSCRGSPRLLQTPPAGSMIGKESEMLLRQPG